MKVVALVPIKLNSQRVPHKNTRDLAGHPLCWYVVKTLCSVEEIDEVCVYCSSEEVERYIPGEARFVKRPARLDGNEVKGAEIYESFIHDVDADVYVLSHTTSPFLSKESVEWGVRGVIDGSHDSAFSAQRVQTFAWFGGKPLNYDLTDVPRTQDIEPVWVETSGFYIFRKELFTERHRRIGDNPLMVEVDDFEAVDIDEEQDLALAQAIAQSRAAHK